MMATIASLAIKISADIGNLTKKAQEVSASIESIAKVAQNATPGMKNLADATSGLSMMLGTLSNNTGSVHVDELQTATEGVYNAVVRQTESMANQFKTVEEGTDIIRNALNLQGMNGLDSVVSDFDTLNDAVQNVAQSIADKIGQLGTQKPSMEGIYQAQQELENLRRLSAETAAVTGRDLSAAVAAAEKNVHNFSNAAVNAQLAMQNFNAVVLSVQNLPFQLISNTVHMLYDQLKNVTTFLDSRFGGWIGNTMKIAMGLFSIVAVLGVIHTQLLANITSTAFWQSLMNSNVIVLGFKAVLVHLGLIAGTQTTINTLTLVWLSMLTFGIAAVIAAVVALVARWRTANTAVEDNAALIEHLTEQHKEYTEQLDQAINRHRELNDLAKQFKENNIDSVGKYLQQVQQINALADFDGGGTLKEVTQRMVNIQEQLGKAERAGNQELAKMLQEQYDGLFAQSKELVALRDSAAEFNKEDKRRSLAAAKNALLESEFGELMREELNARQRYILTLDNMDALVQNNIVTEGDLFIARKNLTKRFENELAQERGIGQYLKRPFEPETLIEVEAKISDYFDQLGKLGLSTEGLVNAQNRAKEMFEKQSEFYDLYQQTLQESIPLEERINAAKNKLVEDATRFGWKTDGILDKMLEALDKKMRPVEEAANNTVLKAQTADNTPSTQNAALVRGTVAYFEEQNRGQKPLLDETKKQTAVLVQIRDNGKKNLETNIEFAAV